MRDFVHRIYAYTSKLAVLVAEETTNTRRSENRQPWGLPETPQLKGSVLRRSAILALIIGSTLTWINQFDALFGSDTIQVLPLLLAYVTPFAVIAISQLAGIRQARRDARKELIPRTTENLVATAFLDGIPARAVTIGLTIGTINAAIILSGALVSTGDIGAAPALLLVQVYTLPVLFGFLSQAVSYQRAARIFAA